MVALSILSTLPPSNSSHSHYFNHYECKYNIYNNNVFVSNSKPQCWPSSHCFSLSTTSIVSKPNHTSLKISSMHTHFSKSGREQSWIQDNSMHQLSSSSDKYVQGPLYSFFPEATAQVSSVKDLNEFICSGPLVSKVGLTEERITEERTAELL